jgi:hypothetical protein
MKHATDDGHERDRQEDKKTFQEEEKKKTFLQFLKNSAESRFCRRLCVGIKEGGQISKF